MEKIIVLVDNFLTLEIINIAITIIVNNRNPDIRTAIADNKTTIRNRIRSFWFFNINFDEKYLWG
mgnify:FL=1